MNIVLKLLLKTLEAQPIFSLNEDERAYKAWLRELDRCIRAEHAEIEQTEEAVNDAD